MRIIKITGLYATYYWYHLNMTSLNNPKKHEEQFGFNISIQNNNHDL